MRLNNPPIPYDGPIKGGLKPGMTIYFKGTVNRGNIKRFHINLQAGRDRTMHFNPRFPQKLVVFNTFHRNRWQIEERVKKMPFNKGETFEVVFNVTKEGYEVNVNGEHFYLFKHRLPVSSVTGLQIAGDATFETVLIDEEVITQRQAVGQQECQLPVCPPKPKVQVMPHVEYIYGRLRPGMTLQFKGTFPKDSDRFSINLHCGVDKGCDIAFHFNPRAGQNVVVFNTCRNGGWENEERPGDMPFANGEDFEVIYVITSVGYQVIVNKKEFHMFKHRMNLEDVTSIKFGGDVSMESVHIIQGVKTGLCGYLSQAKILVPTPQYLTQIPGGLMVGMYLYFRGTVQRKVDSFHINLEYFGKRNRVKALHFKTQLSGCPWVAFNTFSKNIWQKPEKVKDMPFQKGEKFEILLYVDRIGYRAFINGCAFYMYKHRVPLQHVRILSIGGDVSMDAIDIIGGGRRGIEGFEGLRTVVVKKTPHLGHIYGGLRIGTHLYFRGTVPNDAKRFFINFQVGQMKGSFIGLHFKAQFKPSEMVSFNSFKSKKWEKAETVNKIAFQKGEPFELFFIITNFGFQVIINGRPFHLFAHRQPVHILSAIKIGGDVSMQNFNIIRGVKGALEHHQRLRTITITKLPHTAPIHGGVRVGMAMFFRGTVPKDSKRFIINLQLGQLKESNKAMHFKVLFEPSEAVMFNSQREGNWEVAEKVERMPFTKGGNFELVFVITVHGIQVNVNGRCFHVYKHRMPIGHVCAVKVAGDVSMETVHLSEPETLTVLRGTGVKKLEISSIPFVGAIHGWLRTGLYMYFRGRIPEEIQSFEINLQNGTMEGCDKALHMKPRFEPTEEVVFNSFHDDQWQQEERVRRMPFKKGQDFEMFIIVDEKGFQVFVSGRRFHFFRHRLGLEQMSTLSIAGQVTMQPVTLIRGGIGLRRFGKMVVTKLPHVGPIYGGLRRKMFVFFRGAVPENSNSFAINLQCGELEGCDKALQFKAVFSPSEFVTCNSFKDGNWQEEEKILRMPFQKGKDFELVFVITRKGYQVLINGCLFHIYTHRIPMEHVSAMEIDGDVKMESVDTMGGEEDEQEDDPDFGKLVISKIPHLGPIVRTLWPGLALHFQGEVPEDSKGFFINLQYGQSENSDIALQLKAQFDPCAVVSFNSFRNGSWEKEETVYKAPFTKGESFVIVILIAPSGYQILVNNEKFYFFKRRMSVAAVNAIHISGDVSIESLDTIQEQPEQPEEIPEEEVVERGVQYVGPFYGGLKTGISIYFRGRVPKKADGFSFILRCGPIAGNDSAFCFNPQFKTSTVVFNHCQDGRLEQEEVVEKMPFTKGEAFEVVFVVTSEAIKVHVNDSEFHTYAHRISMEQVTGIQVLKDVVVPTVDIVQTGQEGAEGRLSWGSMIVNQVPYVGHVYTGLKKGMYLYFKGKTAKDFSSFHINLQYGLKENSEKALQFKAELEPKERVVLNCYRDGNWGAEEEVNMMPFSKGEDFELLFLITQKGYQVIINGHHFYFFPHRLPVEQVSFLGIGGDVSIDNITTMGSGPGSILSYRGLRNIMISKNPHTEPIYCGLRTGTYIYFYGTVVQKPKSFHFSLPTGTAKHSDIAFHLNAQFEPKERLACNSFRNSKWEKPEVIKQMPFKRGEEFVLLFVITSAGYQVIVNGQLLHSFPHRMPVNHVGAFKVGGTVNVKNVKMIRGGEGCVPSSLRKMIVSKIPHVGTVIGGLKPGMFLHFKGTIPQDMKSFAINLQYGEKEGSDTALHFKPQFDPTEEVVFNNFHKGSFGKEEKVDLMPFTRGEDFELHIFITLRGFQVNVNGSQFYFFKHRTLVQNVTAINIFGDVTVKTVDMNEEGQEEEEKPAQEMTIPLMRPVQGGIKTGTYLFFKGTVPQDSKSFVINLQYAEVKNSDIALHFMPQFEPTEAVVFKTFKKGTWEAEEVVEKMPFAKGEDFEIFIFITTKAYEVLINGQFFHTFNHRMAVDQVSAINVTGEVILQTIDTIRRGPAGVPGKVPVEKVVVSKIPHVGPVIGGLKLGMFLCFRGTIPHSIERFSINMQYGQMKDCDKALCFTTQFTPTEELVFNSFKNNNWETEEKVAMMPFRKGAQFELVFVITLEGFQMFVNGRRSHLFRHRMPAEYVTAIEISGDISMQTIQTITRPPAGQPGQPGLGKMAITKVPHVAPVFGGFMKGMVLYFRGIIPENMKRFSIDLQYGSIDGSDKALHFRPQLSPTEEVIFNSFRNGAWEKEEKVDHVPFEPGEKFELVFIITTKGCKIKVNGHRFYTFARRMPWEYVTAVKIAGDVTMEMGNITEGGEDEEEEKIVPGIPQVGPIIGGLRTGMDLHFSGTLPEKLKSFIINLQCGDTEGCNTALHFKPQLDTSEVVFNSFKDNSWGTEDNVKQMPFDAGEDFEMVIRVLQKGYQIVVNDNDFHFFEHRVAIVDVTHIKIVGDVFVNCANILEGGRVGQGQLVVNRMPYFGPIPCGLKTGTYLYFRGRTDDDINKFYISLECGEKRDCEKALYFQPQFQPDEGVAFNSFLENEWGQEERVAVMPFRKGENFEVVFIVTADAYQVIVNGSQFYRYKHRMPVERVSTIKVGGGVTMEPIKMTATTVQGYRGLHTMVVNKVPYLGPVFGGLKTGMYLYFTGVVPNDVDSFFFNLQYGEHKNSDIALHFKPQFTPKEAVGFNSFKNGSWQNEEWVDKMPFTKGQKFEVVFVIAPEGFHVFVNGQPFYVFKHRMSVQYVNAIKIFGKVTMQTINTIGAGEGCMHPSLGKMVVTKIPHDGPVYGGFRPGMFVLFRGTVPQEAKSFTINLQYGQGEGSDKALHFRSQFEPTEEVVFDSFRSGTWEEEVKINTMPFTKTQKFEVVFVITPEGYQVYTNGHHFYFFEHRMAVEHVSAINITGEVAMEIVDMTAEGKGAPQLPPPGPVVISTTPHLVPVSGGLKPGAYLHFKGTVPQVIKFFAINMQYGQIEGCDKALQFKVQFEPTEGVELNTLKSGSWEEVVQPAVMPFARGQDFEVDITVTSEGYQVNVNGRQLCLFPHRMPAEQVTAVEVVGDVSVNYTNIIQASQIEPVTKIVIPQIPHVVPTYCGLRPGMYLYFNGIIPQDMKSFFINLQYGQMEGSDMAFSFNPQFEPTEAVLFNTSSNGTMGTEDKIEKMPFTKGEPFELLILITEKGYQVNTNGRQFHFFPHRMSVEQVSVINMVGDISVQTLDMIQGGQSFLEGLGKLNVTQIPHIGPLYGSLRPGMALFFQGTVPEDVKSFSIDLQYGQQAGSDIAFQFKPQFEPSEELLFNSFQNGSWGEPQKIEDVPFEPGDTFELAFIVMEEHYQVVLNGQRLCEFAHRMPVHQVSALQITGDVIIGKVSRIGGDEVEIIPEPEIIPDVEPVSEPLKLGRALVFKGTIPSTITNFTVNLRCGNTEDSDIAFQFNPQYEPNELVMLNTRQGGEWGQPESVDNNPFTKGESFELAYIFTETMYQVRVNGADFYEYKHRIPVDQVNCWQIIGEVCMQTTTFVDAEELEPEEVEEVVKEVIAMTDSMKVGTIVAFQGAIPLESKRFGINFMSGETDRAVDLNVVFEPSPSAVFNSFQDGEWGEEQPVAVEHFQRGGALFMIFAVVEGGYQFTLNGAELCLFSYRMPAENVSSIQITGDVDILEYSILVPAEQKEIIQTVQKEVMVTESWTTGTTLTIEGVVPEDARIFTIDLRCGDSEDSEIAFRFSPQFETSEVVFSSFQNRDWGTEEKVDNNPFTKGQKFVVVFLITEQGYVVTVNGAEFYTYQHRITIDQVKMLQILGDVSELTSNIVTAEVYPSPTQLGTVQSETTVSEGLKMEMSLIFRGVIPEEITRFSINLLCGTEKDSDVAFHFAPQFETSEVVFNTYQKMTWGTAEKVDKLPLTKGQPFTITYIINDKGYQVNVDDAEFYFYAHRIPMERVRAVQICGDVIIKIAEVKEPVPEIPLPTKIAPVQCVTPLKGCLNPGMSLSFEGVMPAEITRFLLNLQCGESDDSDAALDINLLFETAEVAFNSVEGGKWQVAEKVTPMPFVKGEKFLLLLNILEDGYEVFVNDDNIHFFKHRIPLKKVTCLQVIADASMQLNYLIRHTERRYPKPAQLGPVQSVTPMAGQLKSGMSLTFEGTIPENITCFCINLQCGGDEGCDTAFHFSPQFSTNQILFNTFRDGKWEVEERVSEMPFRKGESFVLLFIITADGYLVKVNGNELYMFKHRIGVEGVTGMQLIGDVNISTCKIIESAPSVTVLPQGLAAGTHVIFQGTAPPESDGFSIDLLCGCDEGSDSAFQFTAQFEPLGALALNTCEKSVWGEPVVAELPFARGETFDILFMTTPDGYQVQVDGEDVAFYKYRIGLDRVRALRISGNVSMPAINIIEGAGLCPTSCFDTVVTTMPSVMSLAGALKADTSMNFKITIPEDIPSFTIDLACGDGPDADTALQFNAQFEPSASLGINSFVHGRWNQQETITPMPFQRGMTYDLAFDITEEGYQVNVNNAEIHRYEHHVSVDQVQAMRIVGNIKVEDVNIIERSMCIMPGGGGTFMLDIMMHCGKQFYGVQEWKVLVTPTTVSPTSP